MLIPERLDKTYSANSLLYKFFHSRITYIETIQSAPLSIISTVSMSENCNVMSLVVPGYKNVMNLKETGLSS